MEISPANLYTKMIRFAVRLAFNAGVACFNAVCLMQCVAFDDINAQAPVHFLVLPREPIRTLADATDTHEQVSSSSPIIVVVALSFSLGIVARSSVACWS